ncbi:D-beta-hydroxybutyrate dehydrogenase, mitochondrial [Eumeta japonica]|uniref:D-beta-hydroxybutyrate dehydrogenase, mitochondrial n=1 Tax=Eumeta variegata TaxID=151549 RepID=A0A4C1T4R1_EUMVA|nr:D-beta-hydroxybutyrate dehydrogenase, mitochondrial [Eumeta japonica]
MEPLTWVSLCLQLAALCCAVGALLLYLLRKGRVADRDPVESAKTVLVTSLDTALGLQIATYLSAKGWRVLGGCKSDGLGRRLAESWIKDTEAPAPRLNTLELDVAREDLLEEAARATAQHLPAGEHGIWAVINTAGCSVRGGAARWESALRGNVLGALRVARAFSPLLAAAAQDHPHAGRLFYIGLTSDTACESLSRDTTGVESEEVSAGAAAARWGVWGAAHSLRSSLRGRNVHVVLLHSPDLNSNEIYAPPVQLTTPSQPASRPDTPTSETGTVTGSCSVTMPGEAAEYSAKVLPTSALKVLEEALVTPSPRDSYYLKTKQDSWFTRIPSFRMTIH